MQREDTLETTSRRPPQSWSAPLSSAVRTEPLHNELARIAGKVEDGRRIDAHEALWLHEHADLEQTFVLEGSLVDDEGEVTVGNSVWRPARSVRSPSTSRPTPPRPPRARSRPATARGNWI